MDCKAVLLFFAVFSSVSILFTNGNAEGIGPAPTEPIDLKSFSAENGTIPFSYDINNTIQPSILELPQLNGSGPRPAGVIIGPDNTRDEFVANEVVFHSENDSLRSFLQEYNGTVLHGGGSMVLDNETFVNITNIPQDNWYLVRVDLNKSSLNDLTQSMNNLGATGNVQFSSEDTARLVSLIAREVKNYDIEPNYILRYDAINEHPLSASSNLDASAFQWMTEDDDPVTSGIQGLSVGVIRAWDYLRYMGLPPSTTGTWFPSTVAIVDGGFALDEQTGVPLGNNRDFNFIPGASRVTQVDLIDGGYTAGGVNPTRCTGGAICNWHGTDSFGVAAARPRNGYGSAGSGGDVVSPILIKTDNSAYLAARAIHGSVFYFDADIINNSFSYPCNWWCRNFNLVEEELGIGDFWQAMVGLANVNNIPVVASAGNDGINLDSPPQCNTFWSTFTGCEKIYPCQLQFVICVGAIMLDKTSQSYSNYGSDVDIWAPTNIISTVTPESSAADGDDIGSDEVSEARGTSASAPFVAGIVGLMKILDPSLTPERATEILATTANPSPDPKVYPGYVDAFRAVEMVKLNNPPITNIIFPLDGATISYGGIPLRASVNDPEPGASLTPFSEELEVNWISDLDGNLCQGADCFAPQLSIGRHTITATATDSFGASASDFVVVNTRNESPEARIVEPLNGETFFDNQQVRFGGAIFDREDFIITENLAWTSNIDGVIGDSNEFMRTLSPGTHIITLRGSDSRGAPAETSINLIVQPHGEKPTVEIISPQNDAQFSPTNVITFQGVASDFQNNPLSGASLTWSSDRDGVLGTGSTLQTQLTGPPTPCLPEFIRHVITLKALDNNGNENTDDINVFVGIVC